MPERNRSKKLSEIVIGTFKPHFVERNGPFRHRSGMSALALQSDPPSPGQAIEVRKSRRQRTLKAGRICVNEGFSTFDVTIRDLSETGARVEFKTPIIIPHRVELMILNTNSGLPLRKDCLCRWQKGSYAGLEFVSSMLFDHELEGKTVLHIEL